MNLLFIDIETTNTDPKTGKILQICAKHYGNKRICDDPNSRFNIKIKREIGTPVDLGALKVTKTSFRDMQNNYEEQTALTMFLNFMLDLPTSKEDPLVIVGHNVAFDINFIKAWLESFNVKGWERLTAIGVQDTATIAKFLQSVGIVDQFYMSLEKLGKNLGLDMTKYKLHDAEGDVDLTSDCYFIMRDRLVKLVNEANSNAKETTV